MSAVDTSNERYTDNCPRNEMTIMTVGRRGITDCVELLNGENYSRITSLVRLAEGLVALSVASYRKNKLFNVLRDKLKLLLYI